MYFNSNDRRNNTNTMAELERQQERLVRMHNTVFNAISNMENSKQYISCIFRNAVPTIICSIYIPQVSFEIVVIKPLYLFPSVNLLRINIPTHIINVGIQ